jgi:hypothetical protein
VEGDYIRVTLRNTLSFPINIEPSGVKYAKPLVADPGKNVTYIWAAPASTIDCNADGETSQMWHYRSTVDLVAHNAAVLFGPMVITRKGYARADGSPKDVDKELFIVLGVRHINLCECDWAHLACCQHVDVMGPFLLPLSLNDVNLSAAIGVRRASPLLPELALEVCRLRHCQCTTLCLHTDYHVLGTVYRLLTLQAGCASHVRA